MKIEHVDIWRLEIPLTTPYRLAFGPVTHYDTIIVDVIGDDGERGFGEATLLPGSTQPPSPSWTLQTWSRCGKSVGIWSTWVHGFTPMT